MIFDDANREKSDFEFFGSYQPVLNTLILSILWGGQLEDHVEVSNYAVLI